MATIRKTYRLRQGKIIEVEEYHLLNYGSPGKGRKKKKKRTPEQMQAVNRLNKSRRCRHRLLEYFDEGDFFLTLTYRLERRPEDMQKALKDFQNLIKTIKRKFKEEEKECYWIRNIEKGTKGGWHIHLIIKNIENLVNIITKAWKHGKVVACIIRDSNEYDKNFKKLADYMTKDENTPFYKNDGTLAKPRIKETSYSTSRNMPLPEANKEKLVRWPKKEKAKKGYEIVGEVYQGINPFGYDYRRYTMVRMNGRC